MNDELYDLFRRRAEAEPTADFADRVMEAVRRERAVRCERPSKGLPRLLLSTPAVRIAACVLACLACMYRMAAVVAVFFAQ
jgi:hypothetical protein